MLRLLVFCLFCSNTNCRHQPSSFHFSVLPSNLSLTSKHIHSTHIILELQALRLFESRLGQPLTLFIALPRARSIVERCLYHPKPNTNILATCIPQFLVGNSHNKPAMMSQILSRTHQSKPGLARVATGDGINMDVQHELHSLDDIASSRPVALSELWNRASLRGKVTKPLKPLQIGGKQIHDVKEISTDTESIVVAQCKPRARLAPMHRSYIEAGHHNGQQTEILQRSRVRSEAYYPTYAHEAREYLWHEKADGHVQQNPLSYCDGYDPSYLQCLRHDYRSVPDGLFYKHQNFLQSEHAIWPAGPCAAPNNTRVPSHDQCPVADHQYIPESYIEPPNGGIGNGYDQSGYGPLEAPDYHYSQRDTHRAALPTETAYSEQARVNYTSHHSVQADAELLEVVRQKLLRKMSSPTRAEASGAAEVQAPNPIRVSLPSHDRKPSSAESDLSKASSKRSIKEEATAFLQSVVENSHLDAKGTSSQHLTAQSEESASIRLQQESHEAEHVKSQSVGMCDRHGSLKDARLVGQRVKLGVKGTNSLLNAGANQHLPRNTNHLVHRGDIAKDNQEDPYDKLLIANSKAVPPPPGLPIPLEQQKNTDFLFFDTLAPNRARLEEADSWFHTDNRGASELRQLVSSIAYDNVEREALLHGTSSPTSGTATAWQTTLLLGNVIANLQLHTSSGPTKHADYFSDYGVVDSACCEPSHGGRCSYFFQDPAVTHWKLPTDRATPEMRIESEDELAGPQVYGQHSGTW
ncbi:uncharacterized protein P174DRAFT_362736 [Aspergillus novofumigatus IBT 16806]|uniref:Uncharacterized protein n=1 Tax=Aspergillus novofumigatus (strain IBT 16806) TaxID=1392255 RepID=A0A2I1CKL4_ASPN1|nr:uncharacterized protein P174DRAFT_362736 [Aspergillus novofumigatus IBT 16806]PKX98162.1 hypothetical protein P174DRAFT_362736 [Aspergillus novofumigatus IBT 16806]